MQILYEDNHLLVVVKPCNLPVQADASGDDDLLTQCKRYIKEKYEKPGEVYLGLVHRLDRPAGGVMVFARTSKAAARLSAQFKGHGTQKKYAALVTGTPAPRAQWSDFLLREETNARIVPEGTPDAKPCSLSYTLQGAENGLSLVDITLFTGRHHQIRAQFSHHGLPLYGDQRYNPRATPGEQLALWAYALTLEHPTLHKRMTFTALPEGKAWQPFADPLAAMEKGFSLVYADARLLVLGKPANLETCAENGESADTLHARAEAVFGTLYPVHRLDANTTGLVLFARTADAKTALDEAIKTRTVQKLYRCVVKGAPQPSADTKDAYLVKDAQKGRVTVQAFDAPDAKPIATAYRTLGAYTDNDTYDMEIALITGRTHQIRAHMAFLGHPVLGDDKYGDREWNRACRANRLYLCAAALRFSFPKDSPLAYLNAQTFRYPPFWTQDE